MNARILSFVLRATPVAAVCAGIGVAYSQVLYQVMNMNAEQPVENSETLLWRVPLIMGASGILMMLLLEAVRVVVQRQKEKYLQSRLTRSIEESRLPEAQAIP